MDDVAEAAGVARASVFRHFDNKAEILRAVEVDAAERAGVIQLIGSVDSLPPLEALLAVIRDGCRIWGKEARVFQEFYGTAPFDEALRPLVFEKEALRHALVKGLVARLKSAGWLRASWYDSQSVANTIWLLTGFDTFDALTRVRGLSTKAAARLIEQTVCGCFIAEKEKVRSK